MNGTEILIYKFYKSISIADPSLMSIEHVTEQLNIKLNYWPHSSSIASLGDKWVICIDTRINKHRQWQHFGHEMGHYFNDETSYKLLNKSYAAYGETKADYFAYHFCVPTFMLQQIKGVDAYDVMNLFNVEFDFAMRRLEMYHSKHLARRTYNAL